jgi:general nucleoside transport system ATP-binding protein
LGYQLVCTGCRRNYPIKLITRNINHGTEGFNSSVPAILEGIMSITAPLILLEGINKSFGKVAASKNINLPVYAGEIHSLLGENGAGKSTLINIISGIYTPDSGVIKYNGKKVKFTSPKDAIAHGIGTIYQHFKLIDAMTARENIMLGQKTGIFKAARKLDGEVKVICEKYGLEVDLDKYVCDMSVGEKQNLEILKVLYRGARMLILDEPTTVFTPQETEKLFKIMRRMKEQGCAVIFISHKMEEVMEISDKITVLRKGETVKTLSKAETSEGELIELMVGRPVSLSIERLENKAGEKLLSIKDLTVLNEEGAAAVKGISFDIKAGEIFGVAGIAGSGQKELCEAVAGICRVKAGDIIFQGESIKGKNPREFIKRGISMSFVPEDRLGMGLVGSMDMVDNLLLKSYHTQKGMLIDRKPVADKAKELKKTLEIKTPGINYPIKYLSGGNIQKILLGRELSLRPKLLVMAYPVRGLDINTCFTVYKLINEAKKTGTAILFIGEDLDVLMQLCDRIMVLCAGKVSGIVPAQGATREGLGHMMVGTNAS